MDDEVIALTLKYTDGTEQRFEFAPQRKEEYGLASRIQDIFSQNIIMLALEDKVMAIPLQNIQSLEISPMPPKLPAFAIRNVKLVL